MNNKYRVFVISPIGYPESRERKEVDELYAVISYISDDFINFAKRYQAWRKK